MRTVCRPDSQLLFDLSVFRDVKKSGGESLYDGPTCGHNLLQDFRFVILGLVTIYRPEKLQRWMRLLEKVAGGILGAKSGERIPRTGKAAQIQTLVRHHFHGLLAEFCGVALPSNRNEKGGGSGRCGRGSRYRGRKGRGSRWGESARCLTPKRRARENKLFST